jgi:hypothetical protein
MSEIAFHEKAGRSQVGSFVFSLDKVFSPAESGAATTVTVVPLHFIRAWRKLGAVPNKGQYAAWVGFETVCTAALVGGPGLTDGQCSNGGAAACSRRSLSK